MPYFDRFDICYAHALLEAEYHIGGILRRRPSNARRNMSTGFQLYRMGFRPCAAGLLAGMTENAWQIYHDLLERYQLNEPLQGRRTMKCHQ